MSSEKVVRYKVHFVWQDDKEERWLRDMARQGLHLVKGNMLCRYVFKRGAPADVVYRLDFARSRRDENYYQLFRDAGWEHVMSCLGWRYWRKTADGSEPEIFTDGASKASYLTRIRNGLVAVGIPCLGVMIANPAYWKVSEHISTGSRLGVMALWLAVAGVYVYAFCKLTRRIKAVSSPA